MSTWKVTVYKEWKEFGEIEIEADTEDEAREAAQEALSSDEGIDWNAENMEPGNQDIESVEKID